MKAKNQRQEILALLEKHPSKAYKANEISRLLGLSGKRTKKLTGLLRRMVLDGEIVSIRRGGYALGSETDLVSGEIRGLRGGKGLVICGKTGKTVFVERSDMKTAMPGDRLLVRIDPESDPERPRGRVIRVLERCARDIVGTLRKPGRFYCVVPVNPTYRQDIYVPATRGAKLGDRVVVRFSNWANEHVSPEGEIVDVIGPEENPSLDTEVAIRQFDLPGDFPSSVLGEAETVANRLSRPGKRLDLRNRLIITIDPKTAKDFDDALSLEFDERNQRILGVHIADVSHFVRPRSALDKEARARGNSVYLVDKVIPMLPEQLSNGVCSLRPDEDRLAFSTFLTLNKQGTVTDRRFELTRIRSKARLTYEEALDMIEGGKSHPVKGVVGLVKTLHKTAQQLRSRRFRRHALELETTESKIVLDENQRMTGVEPVENDVSHQLVEECMVAANEAVATEMAQRGLPIISRYHEAPDEEKIAELSEALRALGFHPGDLNQPKHMAAFLKSLSGNPLLDHATILVLKSMKRAIYSADSRGHYGLAKKYYGHFTSPIRRYADLILHRQLGLLLRGKGSGRLDSALLKNVATVCTERESLADDAERSLTEVKKYRYLADMVERKKAKVYDAVVVKMMNFGMFVDVHDLQLGGLVHASVMSDRFVRYNAKRQTLSDGRIHFGVGALVKVKPCRVDFDARKLDFELA